MCKALVGIRGRRARIFTASSSRQQDRNVDIYCTSIRNSAWAELRFFPLLPFVLSCLIFLVPVANAQYSATIVVQSFQMTPNTAGLQTGLTGKLCVEYLDGSDVTSLSPPYATVYGTNGTRKVWLSNITLTYHGGCEYTFSIVTNRTTPVTDLLFYVHAMSITDGVGNYGPGAEVASTQTSDPSDNSSVHVVPEFVASWQLLGLAALAATFGLHAFKTRKAVSSSD